MATPWGELKEASENVPSFLPLSGPGKDETNRWKYVLNVLIRAALIQYRISVWYLPKNEYRIVSDFI